MSVSVDIEVGTLAGDEDEIELVGAVGVAVVSKDLDDAVIVEDHGLGGEGRSTET